MFKLLVFAALLTVAYSQRQAVAYLADPEGKSGVNGNITFYETPFGVFVVGEVHGLTPGKHGFHIHEYGNISPGCKAMGSHYNPYNMTHGGPNDKIRHVGDLGNIEADNNGIAFVNMMDRVIALRGVNDIVGRGVVVHNTTDDLGKGGDEESLKTGNAGSRLACGVVGKNSNF
ncbi:superoxide dismutase [Cu-Zn]-like [Diorhabda sublineata]|uniref:superoxide dismutase [Cu-Zn]-like n=1 Tax=Diorhabda sublineata TaxID=1163346 RepID=UPI0024E18DAE|nr:superoxide dismutase [Cu-Zn]-like [Diorhabda sublineata]